MLVIEWVRQLFSRLLISASSETVTFLTIEDTWYDQQGNGEGEGEGKDEGKGKDIGSDLVI